MYICLFDFKKFQDLKIFCNKQNKNQITNHLILIAAICKKKKSTFFKQTKTAHVKIPKLNIYCFFKKILLY